MSKKTWFYIGFFILLLVGFYVAMISMTGLGKVKLPVLNTIHPFSFTRQDGQVISESYVAGKVYVAEYFFTSCKGICPKMNHNMKLLYDDRKGEKGFLILSHTVDPETDSVPRMKQYADSLGADPSIWWFLTGSKENLYKTARESYLLDDPQNSSKNIKEQFLHTQFFALVDDKGQVRGIYDGLKQDELVQLRKDIHELLKGE
jgi:protein SCO1